VCECAARLRWPAFFPEGCHGISFPPIPSIKRPLSNDWKHALVTTMFDRFPEVQSIPMDVSILCQIKKANIPAKHKMLLFAETSFVMSCHIDLLHLNILELPQGMVQADDRHDELGHILAQQLPDIGKLLAH
jgi:hypothetical protein